MTTAIAKGDQMKAATYHVTNTCSDCANAAFPHQKASAWAVLEPATDEAQEGVEISDDGDADS